MFPNTLSCTIWSKPTSFLTWAITINLIWPFYFSFLPHFHSPSHSLFLHSSLCLLLKSESGHFIPEFSNWFIISLRMKAQIVIKVYKVPYNLFFSYFLNVISFHLCLSHSLPDSLAFLLLEHTKLIPPQGLRM